MHLLNLIKVSLMQKGLMLLGLIVATQAVAMSYLHMPNKSEWQYFLRQGASFQKEFWQKHKQQQINFSDWSWSWRILWLKSCGMSREPHCIEVLARGFRDEAMVVRAEAITQLGRRFRGSGNADILAQLRSAFLEKRNFRHQELMFIHHNIMRAMAMIGGKRSAEMRKKLSQRYEFRDKQRRG